MKNKTSVLIECSLIIEYSPKGRRANNKKGMQKNSILCRQQQH